MKYKIAITIIGIFFSFFIINMTIALEVYDMPKIPASNTSGAINASSENLTRSVWVNDAPKLNSI